MMAFVWQILGVALFGGGVTAVVSAIMSGIISRTFPTTLAGAVFVGAVMIGFGLYTIIKEAIEMCR